MHRVVEDPGDDWPGTLFFEIGGRTHVSSFSLLGSAKAT